MNKKTLKNLKKELLNIPIFGWYLKKIKSISIDRNKISKENLNFYEKFILLKIKTQVYLLYF